MRKGFVSVHSTRITALAASCIFILAGGVAQTLQKRDLNLRESLETFLRHDLAVSGVPEDKTTRYSSAFVDLRDDGTQEIIVYVSGQHWCGSGGCTMLLLTADGPSYKVVTSFTITRPPIRVLATKTHGWRDIAVQVRGGGQLGYEAGLSFDGKTYPPNPSVPPARPLLEKVAGKVVITYEDEGTPLYP